MKKENLERLARRVAFVKENLADIESYGSKGHRHFKIRNIVAQAREKVPYSKTTAACDIWRGLKYIHQEIKDGLHS